MPRDSTHSLKPLLSATWLHVVLSMMAFVMCLPFLWMVLTSFKPLSEVGLESWLPTSVETTTVAGIPVPRNYVDVFDYENPDPNRRGIQFARFYWNSIIVAAWVTFLQVVTSSMAAFAFSRLHWPGRDRVFLMYLGTMMLPGLVMMIPNFQIMISLRLIDTLPGLILPAAFSAFGTFLLRQFMLTIPASLDEAAEIDGASKWRVFWDVILPMSRPGLITLAIFTFMGNYNSFFWPLVMLKSEARYTLPIGLMYFDGTRGQSTHLLMAAVTMSVAPMVLIFIVLQKYLVKGIQLGAVKG
jgi:multiple sugar transport system permease protein